MALVLKGDRRSIKKKKEQQPKDILTRVRKKAL